MILSPICINIGWTIVVALHESRRASVASIILLCIVISLSAAFIFLPIYYGSKRRLFLAFCCFFIPLVTFSIFDRVLFGYEIDHETLSFYLLEKHYIRIIDAAPSLAKQGEPKLVIVEIEARYSDSKRYIIYDESDRIIDKGNEFFGIGRNYATLQNGEKFHSSTDRVVIRKYSDHFYIVDTYPAGF